MLHPIHPCTVYGRDGSRTEEHMLQDYEDVTADANGTGKVHGGFYIERFSEEMKPLKQSKPTMVLYQAFRSVFMLTKPFFFLFSAARLPSHQRGNRIQPPQSDFTTCRV